MHPAVCQSCSRDPSDHLSHCCHWRFFSVLHWWEMHFDWSYLMSSIPSGSGISSHFSRWAQETCGEVKAHEHGKNTSDLKICFYDAWHRVEERFSSWNTSWAKDKTEFLPSSPKLIWDLPWSILQPSVRPSSSSHENPWCSTSSTLPAPLLSAAVTVSQAALSGAPAWNPWAFSASIHSAETRSAFWVSDELPNQCPGPAFSPPALETQIMLHWELFLSAPDLHKFQSFQQSNSQQLIPELNSKQTAAVCSAAMWQLPHWNISGLCTRMETRAGIIQPFKTPFTLS